MGVIFLVGMVVRLYDLSAPPVDFHPTRQLHSALIARGMYYQQRADLPAWQREMAVSQWRMEGWIEPPIFERITAWSYNLVGWADLRIPRVYAILAWLVAAVFVVWIAVDLTGWGGGLAAAWFFLIWPYGVIASRSFQPEPVLVMWMAMTFWAALRWERHGGWKWAIITGLLAGLSIYFKVVAVFFIAPVLVVLVIARKGWHFFRDGKIWAMALLAVLPYAIYHIDGVYIRGYLVSQFSLRFFPQMWVDPAFYLRWIGNLGRVLPFELVLVSITGVFVIRRPAYRALLIAEWAGYVAYGMALPHHISTHDYYHVLLFPVLTLGFAGVGDIILRNLRGPFWLSRIVVSGILTAGLIITGYSARNTIKRSTAVEQVHVWEQIGALLGHGASVAALVPDYGDGLKYWAWINPSVWLTEDDILFRESIGDKTDFMALFTSQVSGKDFFVVTMLDELDLQPELKSFLYQQYPVYKQTPQYIIFDLRSSAGK